MKILLSFFVIFFTTLPPKHHSTLPSEEEKSILLETHNKWRADVGVSPLQWSNELAESADKWAKKLKRGCKFEHSGWEVGENLWKGTTGAYETAYVVDSWGEEINFYDYESNECEKGKVCGHYTQIVWSTTTKVGCAKIECDGFTTWVCHYDPPGNWIGKKPY